MIGGTFSEADINGFANTMLFPNYKTMRAAAKEGTYSISRDTNFDGYGLRKYYSGIIKTATSEYNASYNSITKSALAGSLSKEEYIAKANTAFNKFLVDLHNGLINGQKQFGYFYSLERRKL